MIKSTKTDVVTTYKSIRNLSACVEKRGRVGMGGWLQFGRGEVGWGRRRGRRRRNRGRECRQSEYVLTFTDGIIDGKFPSVYPLVMLLVNMPRHCTDIPV
jgi:hypothetical protein